MRIIVLGGAGFFGSHVVEALVTKGHEVHVFDLLLHGNKIDPITSKHSALHIHDASDYQFVQSKCPRADLIINLASIVGVDTVAKNPVSQMENEVGLVRATVQLSHSNGDCPIIYASSSSVYGSNLQGKPVQETDHCMCISPYAVAKLWGERYLQASAKQRGASLVVVRPFNLYGPRQDTRMVIPRMCSSAMLQNNVIVLGEGDQTRDFTWVVEAAQGLAHVSDSIVASEMHTPIYNICTGVEIRIMDLAEMIIKESGSASSISTINIPTERMEYEVLRRFGNPSKWHLATSTHNVTDVLSGIRQTIDYYRKQQELGVQIDTWEKSIYK